MEACGDVSEADLLLWCIKHKEEDDIVLELYSRAMDEQKYAHLIGAQTEEQERNEDTG